MRNKDKYNNCPCKCSCDYSWKDTALDIASHAATWLLGFAIGLAAMKFWLWRWLM